MIQIMVFLGAIVLFVLAIMMPIPFILYASWIAAKIWLLLVVPATRWQPIPTIAFVGIGLVIAAIRPNKEALASRSENGWVPLARTVSVAFLAPTLAYGIALLVARFAR